MVKNWISLVVTRLELRHVEKYYCQMKFTHSDNALRYRCSYRWFVIVICNSAIPFILTKLMHHTPPFHRRKAYPSKTFNKQLELYFLVRSPRQSVKFIKLAISVTILFRNPMTLRHLQFHYSFSSSFSSSASSSSKYLQRRSFDASRTQDANGAVERI